MAPAVIVAPIRQKKTGKRARRKRPGSRSKGKKTGDVSGEGLVECQQASSENNGPEAPISQPESQSPLEDWNVKVHTMLRDAAATTQDPQLLKLTFEERMQAMIASLE